MQFFPLLQDPSGRIFLIHCNVETVALHAALLVVDGFVEDEWVQIREASPVHERQTGLIFLVQLPTEVVCQPERYKGYDVVLPLKRIA